MRQFQLRLLISYVIIIRVAGHNANGINNIYSTCYGCVRFRGQLFESVVASIYHKFVYYMYIYDDMFTVLPSQRRESN